MVEGRAHLSRYTRMSFSPAILVPWALPATMASAHMRPDLAAK
jgi:hypothetical protein